MTPGRIPRHEERGLTLIETLAVIVILGLVATFGIGSLAGTAGAAELERVASALQRLDALARITAEREGPVELRIDEQMVRVVASSSEDEDVIIFARAEVPVIVSLGFFSDRENGSSNQSLAVIEYDARGRSIDYRVSVGSGAGSRQWHVAGLTGWVEPIHWEAAR